jgi:arsenate reductase
MFPEVEKYLEKRQQEFDEVPLERQAQLKKIAQFVTDRVKSGKTAKLTFVCTHNSRRSHLSQIWAQVAARHYGIDAVETYSGGTEASAFNPRAVAALRRAGLRIENSADSNNPKYAVRSEESKDPMICFSKVYSNPPNPKEDFCAVMTCSQADENCPIVSGSSLRVAIPYDDPKLSDGTAEEAATYDERCAQISREMMYLFSQVEN